MNINGFSKVLPQRMPMLYWYDIGLVTLQPDTNRHLLQGGLCRITLIKDHEFILVDGVIFDFLKDNTIVQVACKQDLISLLPYLPYDIQLLERAELT